MYFFCNIEFGDGSGGGVFNIPISPHAAFCSQCGILSMTTPPIPPPPLLHPPPRPNSFASADDISKELLAPYEAGWGKKAYLDKTGLQSGHGPKGQSPIHVKVAGGVCVGGVGMGLPRGLFESGRIFEARE